MIGKKYFLNVSKGSFFQKAIGENEGVSFSEVTGQLVSISFKRKEQGEIIRLHVVDELNFYMLSMFVHSRPANAFFRMVKNLDLKSEMCFRMTTDKGKDFFSIIQNSSVVAWYYDKNNESELPFGKEERHDFFKGIILNEIIPVLQKRLNPFPNHFCYKPMHKDLQGGYFDNERTHKR